jgi:pyridoxal phosphate enzyme (YggS family)
LKNETIDSYQHIKDYLGNNITLVAVSKFRETEAILKLYEKGQRIFAENRVQNLIERRLNLPQDIRWHIIGHLQTNKVKFISSFIDMIQSVDSIGLLEEIQKQAQKAGRIIDVLLQIKIAQEESKFGFDFEELQALCLKGAFQNMPNIQVCGVMGMGTLTEDESLTEIEFLRLKEYFDKLKANYFKEADSFKEISMGMSGDYKIAKKCGTTMVRIGSALFE